MYFLWVSRDFNFLGNGSTIKVGSDEHRQQNSFVIIYLFIKVSQRALMYQKYQVNVNHNYHATKICELIVVRWFLLHHFIFLSDT